MLWAQAEIIDKVKANWIYGAIALGVLIALFVLLKLASSKKKPPDLEKSQREDLADYPPPPPAGSKRLSANGEPARLRLVVIAPAGKLQEPINLDDVPELLEDILRGLGTFIKTDKPRVKLWPPQLSVAGFAPTFHRLVASPDADKKSSRWIKLAGPAKSGKRPFLVGMALLADDATKMGDVHVQPREWAEILQVQK